MVDLTASKDNTTALIEVKGPKELSADSKFTYANMIAGMTRPEISDLINSSFNRKALWGYIGLTRLYCYGIVSELYHYYKCEILKSESPHIKAYFCVPIEDKYSVAIDSAIGILKDIGFIHDKLHEDEYSKDGGKIKIIQIHFNDEITKNDAIKNAEKQKDQINEKIKVAKEKYFGSRE